MINVSSQSIRFVIVGAINTIVGYGIYFLLITLGSGFLIGATVSHIIASINSFVLNRRYTFKSSSKVIFEFIRFSVMNASTLAGNLLLIYIMVRKLHLNEGISGFISLCMMTIISFLGHKYFTFKKKRR